MYSKDAEIAKTLELSAKPASDFVNAAKKYRSDIYIVNKQVQVNAKSILAVLACALRPGTKVSLKAEGPDEVEAVNKLCEIIQG